MIKVTSLVSIYEIDGDETGNADSILKVSAHWNRKEMVNIEFPGQSSLITVAASDLIAARANATNTGRF